MWPKMTPHHDPHGPIQPSQGSGGCALNVIIKYEVLTACAHKTWALAIIIASMNHDREHNLKCGCYAQPENTMPRPKVYASLWYIHGYVCVSSGIFKICKKTFTELMPLQLHMECIPMCDTCVMKAFRVHTTKKKKKWVMKAFRVHTSSSALPLAIKQNKTCRVCALTHGTGSRESRRGWWKSPQTGVPHLATETWQPSQTMASKRKRKWERGNQSIHFKEGRVHVPVTSKEIY